MELEYLHSVKLDVVRVLRICDQRHFLVYREHPASEPAD